MSTPSHFSSIAAAYRSGSLAPPLAPSQLPLVLEAAGVFTDHRARLAEASVAAQAPAGQPFAVAALSLDASQRYRLAIARHAAAAGAEGGAEAERLQLLHAVWHAAEVALLAEGGGAGLDLLDWLADSFLEPPGASDALLAAAVAGLRAPPRGGGAAAAVEDAWDVCVRLVVEGRPEDGGRLLCVLAAASGEPSLLHLGELLAAYPPATRGEPLTSAAAAWHTWRESAVALRREVGRPHPHPHPSAELLLSLAAGEEVSAVLSRFRAGGLGGARLLAAAAGVDVSEEGWRRGEGPFVASWPHHALAALLYGAAPPSTTGRRELGAHLRAAMQAAGVGPVSPGGAGGMAASAPGGAAAGGLGGAAAGAPPQDVSTPSGLAAGLLSLFSGDAGWPLGAMQQLGAGWAAVHLVDLLWGLRLLDGLPATWPGGAWHAPHRAHLLLQHAAALCAPAPARPAASAASGDNRHRHDAGRAPFSAALVYAVASTPEAVGAEVQAMEPEEGEEEEGWMTAAAEEEEDAPSRTRAHARLTIALASGSAPAAHALMRLILTEWAAAPAASARDVAAAAAAAARLGLGPLECEMRAGWAASLCGAGEGEGEGVALGTALHAALAAASACRHTPACSAVDAALDLVGARLLSEALQVASRPAPLHARVYAAWRAVGAPDVALPGEHGRSLSEETTRGLGLSRLPEDLRAALGSSRPLRAAFLVRRLLAALVALEATAGGGGGRMRSPMAAAAAGEACSALHALLLPETEGGVMPLCPVDHLPPLIAAAAAAGVLATPEASPALLHLALQRLGDAEDGKHAAVTSEVLAALASAVVRAAGA